MDIQFIVIDLFCGAGGTTVGFEEAIGKLPGRVVAKVVAAVNHDPIAIQSHWKNHPDVEHFEEDITTLYGFYQEGILMKTPRFMRLIRLIDMYRAFYPDAYVILWASLECTNFSNAKGGLPRDADSRTLAEHLHPYILAIDPDYVKIENVVEFMAWGPLDENGRPVSRKNGRDWIRWRRVVCSHGYRDEWREMNAADFGALTSRNRLFGCFAKDRLPIVWPEPTHSKNPQNTSIVSPLRKWEPVKKALDFGDEGKSVFNRKKPLSSKTMQRLFMGCVKHIAGGKQSFISKYYSGNPQNKNSSIDDPAPSITTKPHESLVFITKWNSNNKKTGGNNGHSVQEPAPVITTQNRLGLAFITKAYSSNSNKDVNPGSSVEEPCHTVTVQNRLGIAQAHFIQKYYSSGGQHNSIEEPAATITSKDRLSKVTANFLDKYYSGDHNHQSIEQPSGAILSNDKHNLVSAEKFIMPTDFNNGCKSIDDPLSVITADRHYHYIVNPSWGGNTGSVDEPCHVVIARQDKAPLYLITCKTGPVSVPVYEDDCEWTIRLKEFMSLYDIVDIKMRMLKVQELKVIQGFPSDYVLLGNQTDQKKFIGNAVHPKVPRFWIEAMSKRLIA